jgi:hypothetical protein
MSQGKLEGRDFLVFMQGQESPTPASNLVLSTQIQLSFEQNRPKALVQIFFAPKAYIRSRCPHGPLWLPFVLPAMSVGSSSSLAPKDFP